MKLIIDRAKWLRGEPKESYLLHPTSGKMCCLGFFGAALGLLDCNLHGRDMPSSTGDDCWPDWLVTVERGEDLVHPEYDDTKTGRTLATDNDSVLITEPVRESRIAAEFAKHGVEVEFV